MDKNGTGKRHTSAFYVVGNGPSLTSRVMQALPDGSWLGMNSAFRYWDKIGKYPRYYACLDPVVVKSQFDGIRHLLDRPEIDAFFLHDCVVELDAQLSAHPKVTLLSRFLAQTDLRVPMSRLALQKQTTGALATRFVLERGHRDLMLIGIDCKYVERLAESAGTQGIELVITKKVQNNPNYFFSDYQAAGDKYQVPNPAVHSGNLHLQSFVALRQDLEDAGVDARIAVGAQRSLLSRFGVFPTVSIWQALDIRRIGAVVVPLTPREWQRQVENLSLWLDPKLRPSLRSGACGTVLHLFFSGAPDPALEHALREAIAALPELQEYFAEVRITFLDIPPEIDHYVRNAAGSDEPCTKSGPNVFFLATMAHCREYEYVLHAETDCLPVRAGWLDAADGEIDRAGSQAWIIGPAYAHASHLHAAYSLHINGNAIYQTGDPDFQQFLQSTFFEGLKHLIRSGFRDMAYDTALSVLNYNLQALPPTLRHALLMVLPRFAFSHFIRNVGGTAETAKPELVDVRGILEESDATYMMHGRPAFHHLDGDRSFLPSLFNRSTLQPREELPLFWAGGSEGAVTATALGYGEVLIEPAVNPPPSRIRVSLNYIRLTTRAGKRRFDAAFCWPSADLSGAQFSFVLRNAAGKSRQLSASAWRSHAQDEGLRVEVSLDGVDVADAITVSLILDNLPYRGEALRIVHARLDECLDRTVGEPLQPIGVRSMPPSDAAREAIQQWGDFYAGLPRLTNLLQPYRLNWESDHFLARNVILKPGIVDLTLASGGLPADARTPAFVCVMAALNWRQAQRFTLSVRVSGPVTGEAVLRLCRHGQAPWEYHDISVSLMAGFGVVTVEGPAFRHDHPAYRLELLRCTGIDGQFTMQVVVEWPEHPVAMELEAPKGSVTALPVQAPRWDAGSAATPPRVLIIDSTLSGSLSATGQLKQLFFRAWPAAQLAQVWDPFVQDGRHAFTAMVNPSQRTLGTTEELMQHCRAFEPDVIYVRPDDNLAFLETTVRLCADLARPVMLHLMDDWMERARVRDPARWKPLTVGLQALIDRATVRLSICPTMSRMLEARHGGTWHALANGVPMPTPGDARVNAGPAQPFVIRYMGGLASDMSRDSVLLVARAVERLSSRWPVRFEICTMAWYVDEARELFKPLGATTVGPLVDANAYGPLLRSSSALLIAYNFDAASIAYTRYSFSNKLPECLAAGCPVILVGPREVATVREIGDHPAVACIDRPDPEEVVRRIEEILTSADRRERMVTAAADLVRTRFLDEEVVRRMRHFAAQAASAGNRVDSERRDEHRLSFSEANMLQRQGKLLEALHAYVRLAADRDLAVYRDNARLCLRRLNLDEASLEHAVAAVRARASP